MRGLGGEGGGEGVGKGAGGTLLTARTVVSLATGGGQMVACTGTEDVYVFAAEER